MKTFITLFIAVIALLSSACAPSTSAPGPSSPKQAYDFSCNAVGPNGETIKYGYYKHIVDATANNMGMRNFVMVEIQIDDRFNSIDLNEEYVDYNEKVVYLNTSRGAYKVKTDYAISGGNDNTIIVELLGTVLTLTNVVCEK